jgi:hypothetical protein
MILLLALILARPELRSTAQEGAACPDDDTFPARLVVGETGRVLSGQQVNLRPQPTTSLARLATIDPGIAFDVIGGPECANGYRWWQVRVRPSGAEEVIIGWMADGDPSSGEVWLEARGERVIVEVDGRAIAFVIDADGDMEREDCLRPPDDYARVSIGYATLNMRTLAMLDHANRIYRSGGGFVDFRQAITQGSYNAGGEAASFGTHDGGGAVDLSVRSYIDFSVLTGEIEPMIEALRVAGFAAWLRQTGQFYRNSPIHIHAIAIGDAEISPAAQEQIDGERGYLRAFNGLPEEYAPQPVPDEHGGPIVCGWMRDLGYDDLRPQAEATPEADSTPEGE